MQARHEARKNRLSALFNQYLSKVPDKDSYTVKSAMDLREFIASCCVETDDKHKTPDYRSIDNILGKLPEIPKNQWLTINESERNKLISLLADSDLPLKRQSFKERQPAYFSIWSEPAAIDKLEVPTKREGPKP